MKIPVYTESKTDFCVGHLDHKRSPLQISTRQYESIYPCNDNYSKDAIRHCQDGPILFTGAVFNSHSSEVVDCKLSSFYFIHAFSAFGHIIGFA